MYKSDEEIELAIALENEEQFYNQLRDSLQGENQDLFIKYAFIKDKIENLKNKLAWNENHLDNIIWVIFLCTFIKF